MIWKLCLITVPNLNKVKKKILLIGQINGINGGVTFVFHLNISIGQWWPTFKRFYHGQVYKMFLLLDGHIHTYTTPWADLFEGTGNYPKITLYPGGFRMYSTVPQSSLGKFNPKNNVLTYFCTNLTHYFEN